MSVDKEEHIKFWKSFSGSEEPDRFSEVCALWTLLVILQDADAVQLQLSNSVVNLLDDSDDDDDVKKLNLLGYDEARW